MMNHSEINITCIYKEYEKGDTKLIILKALCQSVKPSLTPNIYLIKLFSIKLFKMFHPFENNLFPFVLIETEQAFPQLESTCPVSSIPKLLTRQFKPMSGLRCTLKMKRQ